MFGTFHWTQQIHQHVDTATKIQKLMLQMCTIFSAKIKNVFVKHYAPGGNKAKKDILSFKVSQGDKAIDIGVIYTEYEVSISNGSKVIAKVKVDNS